MDNPVGPPPVKPPEIFVEQKLIVIALRKKVFSEKQAVIEAELKAGWHVKDIQLGVGKQGVNGFMSILLEREYGFTAPPKPDGSPFYTWHEETTKTKYRDPHGLIDDEPYTLQDGEEIDDDQPHTFNDDGPDLEENDDAKEVGS